MDRIIFQWALALIAASFASIPTYFNWRIFYGGWIKKEKTPSTCPFIGGLAFAFALYLIPNNPYHHLFWLGLFVDIACVPSFIWLIYIILKDIFQKGKSK